MTLVMPHCTAYGGIIFKASLSTHCRARHQWLFGNIHSCYFSEAEAYTLDTVKTNLNSIWLL